MERVYLSKILARYQNRQKRKPLVVWGARQVGKTYLVKDLFAKDYLKDYVYIDLKKDQRAAAYFAQTVDDEGYLRFTEGNYGKVISEGCPLIID